MSKFAYAAIRYPGYREAAAICLFAKRLAKAGALLANILMGPGWALEGRCEGIAWAKRPKYALLARFRGLFTVLKFVL